MDGWMMDRSTVELLAAIGGGTVLAYLLIELLVLHFVQRRLDLRIARMALLGLVVTGGMAPVIAVIFGAVSVGIAAYAGSRLAPFEVGTAWYGWVYGFFVYEFFYWVQHWLAHKVRLLWCIHSPHHAPGGIHMAIGANHHFVEALLYFPLFFGFVPALFGVSPVILIAVNALDGLWGSFLHISDRFVTRGRYGPLGRFLQTPSHHRVHHAKNARYIDRNYNSITLFWDWALGTLEPLSDEEPVSYGITRAVDDGSFWDVHFGECVALARDIRGAKSAREAWGYALRPPGWRPGDGRATASEVRRRWAEQERG